MDIILANHNYKVIDTKEKITIADSFVVRQNKIGGGNGEAKLYIGQDNAETRSFFGNEGFAIPCFLIWLARKAKILALPDKIEFEVIEQTQIVGPRVYVNSNDKTYKLIRELSLPNITFISVIKLIDEKGQLRYYFRLFADYFGEVEHPYVIEKEEEEIFDSSAPQEEKKQLIRARVGQGEYRIKLLAECPFCPITLVSDDRLLTASHIKPWAMSDDFEKTDPKNGFMLTPTFDRLFDRGFLSFTDDKKTILSPFLSNMTYSKLEISDNKIIPHLPIEGRELYLDFHRKEILKK